MPLSDAKSGPDPGSVLAWQILAPITALFFILVVVSGLAARQFFEPLAMERDLLRAERYAQFSAVVFGERLNERTPQELTEEFERAGLHTLDFLPPESTPAWKSPRFLDAGPFVEAWSAVTSADGTPLGVITLRRQADAFVFVTQAIRAFAFASCVTFALLFALAWLLLKRRVTNRLRNLMQEVGPAMTTPEPGSDVVEQMRITVAESLAREKKKTAPMQRLLDGHTEMACSSTPEGTLLAVNSAYSRFFGKSREQLVGTNYLDLIPPADRSDAIASVRKLSRRNPVSVAEHRVVLADGTIRWVRWRDRATFDSKGNAQEILSFGVDVTPEKDLAARIEGLRIAFDQMQSLAETGSLTWDFAADRMEWTPETRRLLGVGDSASASSEGLLEVVAPDERETVRSLLRSARKEGHNFQREFRVVLPDGSLRVLQSRAEVLADPKTKLLNNLTCTLRDTTALRDAEAATKRELRFREAIEQSLGVGIVVRNMERRTLSANPAFCVMTGFSEEELKAAIPPDEPYWPVDERPRILAALEQALSGNSPTSGFELVFCRKNGSRFDALVNVSTVLGSNGKPFAVLGAVADISAIQKTRRELVAAEKELRQELNYRDALEKSTTVGLIEIGSDGGPTSANNACCQMFGYSNEEILKWKPPYPCWPDEEHENIQRAFELHLQGKTPLEGFQLRLRKKDGTLFDVIITVSPIMNADGKQTGFLSALTDVTALQDTRRELQATNKRLHIAQDVAEFGIWDWNPVKDTLHWDRQSFALFGYPDATDPKEVWVKANSEEDQERLTYELKRLIANGGTSGQDRLRVQWPDGSIHDILSTYVITHDEEGRNTRVVGINRDVTCELEEERELHNAQERLAAALEGGQFGTFEHVFGLGDLNWSPTNYEINGIDRSITDPAQLFKAWRDITGDCLPELMQRMSSLPITENHLTYEFTAHPTGQEPRRVRASVFIERNKQGHPTRLVGITRRVD
jgi:PAS domain S-box-containing protein